MIIIEEIIEYRPDKNIVTVSLIIGKKSRPWVDVGVNNITTIETTKKYLVNLTQLLKTLLLIKVIIEKINTGRISQKIDSLNVITNKYSLKLVLTTYDKKTKTKEQSIYTTLIFFSINQFIKNMIIFNN